MPNTNYIPWEVDTTTINYTFDRNNRAFELTPEMQRIINEFYTNMSMYRIHKEYKPLTIEEQVIDKIKYLSSKFETKQKLKHVSIS